MTSPSTTANGSPAAVARPRRRWGRTTGVAGGVLAALLALLFAFPLLRAAILSLTDGGSLTTANYGKLADFGAGLLTYLWNSAVVTVITVAGSLALAIPAGYGFARYSFRGKNLIFVLILAILMIPHPTILIPLYVLLGDLGLQNTLIGVALVMIMFQLPFSVFMMRIAFSAVPEELEEAAMLDGCSETRAMLRVSLAAVVPSVVTVGLFAFFAAWNEFLTPLILLNDGSRFTLPIALVSLRSGDFGAVDLGALQAGVIVSALPCVVLFLLLQRHYVRGLLAGALRG
nr:carbohydrate ABC transporter permease [Jiangella mangrovi]